MVVAYCKFFILLQLWLTLAYSCAYVLLMATQHWLNLNSNSLFFVSCRVFGFFLFVCSWKYHAAQFSVEAILWMALLGVRAITRGLWLSPWRLFWISTILEIFWYFWYFENIFSVVCWSFRVVGPPLVIALILVLMWNIDIRFSHSIQFARVFHFLLLDLSFWFWGVTLTSIFRIHHHPISLLAKILCWKAISAMPVYTDHFSKRGFP